MAMSEMPMSSANILELCCDLLPVKPKKLSNFTQPNDSSMAIVSNKIACQMRALVVIGFALNNLTKPCLLDHEVFTQVDLTYQLIV